MAFIVTDKFLFLFLCIQKRNKNLSQILNFNLLKPYKANVLEIAKIVRLSNKYISISNELKV